MKLFDKDIAYGTFKYLLIGDTISNAGDRFQKIAFPLLMYKITDSATILSITVVLEIIPQIILSLILGSILARCNIKKVLYIDVSIATLLTAMVPLLVFLKASYIFLMIVAMGLSAVTLVYDIVVNTTIGSMYPKDKLLQYNSLLKSARTITKILAPSIAGVWVATLGYSTIFIFNAFSFICLLVCIKPLNFKNCFTQSEAFNIKELLFGYTEIISSKLLIILTIVSIFINIMMLGFNSVLVYILKHTFVLSSDIIGLVYSLSGIGSLIGAFLMTKAKENSSVRLFNKIIIFSSILVLAFMVPLIFFNWKGIGICYLLISMSITVIDIIITTLIQEKYKQPKLGFIFSALFVLSTAFAPLGSIIATSILEKISAYGVIVFFLIADITTLCICFYGANSLGEEEEDDV